MSIIERVTALHRSLEVAGIRHAFGGALALGWCTLQARGTVDVDLNVFVSADQAREVLAALPVEVTWGEVDVDRIEADGQARLWWDETPIDLFFSTTPFHEEVAERCRLEPFAGGRLPFLSCTDLAVFKAFFDRTRDWADLEAMAEAGTLDVAQVIGVLRLYLGGDDHRIERLVELHHR